MRLKNICCTDISRIMWCTNVTDRRHNPTIEFLFFLYVGCQISLSYVFERMQIIQPWLASSGGTSFDIILLFCHYNPGTCCWNWQPTLHRSLWKLWTDEMTVDWSIRNTVQLRERRQLETKHGHWMHFLYHALALSSVSLNFCIDTDWSRRK